MCSVVRLAGTRELSPVDVVWSQFDWISAPWIDPTECTMARFFMFYLDCGYYGAAIAQNLVMLIFLVAQIVLVIRKGYGFVFEPSPSSVVWTRKGIYHYLALAIPGLFQNAFEWIIEEVAVILAGYVAQPTIALSTTVILSNLFLVVISFSVAICNATNIRVWSMYSIPNLTRNDSNRIVFCFYF